ncbi:MAG: ABC transporter ATP-binding protein [Pirellulaceae bacterium]|nr:ABC transporter ATP-binding protein [Pirellulaceae bacterium]
MIQLKGIGCRAGQFSLNDVSLAVESGQYAVLMGQTGQGKTTLLEIICGLRPPSAGQVLVRGVDVTHWAPGDRDIGYVPQDLALFPHMRVREHLTFALRLRRQSSHLIAQRVDELSHWLGISHLLGRTVEKLSGGEAQRVALGRALAFRPAVLLLDEPLSALDEVTRHEMHELLKRLKQDTGMTTLHITHNADETAALADRYFRLVGGRIVEQPLPTSPQLTHQ